MNRLMGLPRCVIGKVDGKCLNLRQDCVEKGGWGNSV